ncbi:HET-domain-containing protein [Apiospora arundinis]
MHLINTRTQCLEEFVGRNIPRYAILSHTWEDEEVLFRDMSNSPPSSATQNKKGFQKIAWTCRIAAQDDGLDYAWIDTCCIDKSSSAELTEAINSMFKWYQRAEVCYAFLSDLQSSAPLETALPDCRWWTRGWTLQELLAPKEVRFFDQEWNVRGTRSSLTDLIFVVTQIKVPVLRQEVPLSSVCVAQRLSWAARRETTRVEDMAYCLLGLFDVNMPLLYGEEEKAFRRLQCEILQSTVDLSIFAWKVPARDRHREGRDLCGVLADSPEAFAECTAVETWPYMTPHDLSVTNIGIKTQARIFATPKTDGATASSYLLRLNCYDPADPSDMFSIWLRKCAPDQFLREDPGVITRGQTYTWVEALRVVYLLTGLPLNYQKLRSEVSSLYDISGTDKNYGPSRLIAQTRSSVLRVKLPPWMSLLDVWDVGRFDLKDQLFIATRGSWQDVGALRLRVAALPDSDDGGDEASISSYDSRNPAGLEGMDILCYVLGWAANKPDLVQCTVLDYWAAHESGNRSAITILKEPEFTKDWVFEELVDHKIARRGAVALSVPDSDYRLVVSVSLSWKQDSSVCSRDFLELEFSGALYRYSEVPKIETRPWKRS